MTQIADTPLLVSAPKRRVLIKAWDQTSEASGMPRDLALFGGDFLSG